jgi:hypothetical protein
MQKLQTFTVSLLDTRKKAFYLEFVLYVSFFARIGGGVITKKYILNGQKRQTEYRFFVFRCGNTASTIIALPWIVN